MAQPLRDPDWPGEVRQCICCGYSLRGLGTPCTCPECGFAVDSRTLVLHGILNRHVSASPIRRALWAVVFIALAVISYTAGLIAMAAGWVILLVLVLVFLGLAAALIATSRRERAGRFAFVFTLGGFLPVVSLDDDRPEGEPTGWAQVEHIELTRVSPVWRKLKVHGQGRVLLDAGVRCPDDQAERVFETLEGYRLGRDSPIHNPPSTRSAVD